MWLSKQQKYRRALIDTIIIVISILLLVYPLEVNARELVRIHHSGGQSSGMNSSSVRESYDASRQDRARRDANQRVDAARDSLDNARSYQSRIQSEGPSHLSPNTHYRELMDAQGDVDRAQSELREENNRAYWEQRR